MKPQARRVLRHLQNAGAAGVHSRDLRQDYIADPPTRVCELLRLGFNISREKEGNGTRYVLNPAEEGAVRDASALPDGPHTRPPDASTAHVSPPCSDGGGALSKDGAGPVRYPANALKDWLMRPDDREGWHLVGVQGEGWHWELREPVPAQTELIA